jgi:hypothetical protein
MMSVEGRDMMVRFLAVGFVGVIVMKRRKAADRDAKPAKVTTE